MSKKEKDPVDIEIGSRLKDFRENIVQSSRETFASMTSLSLQFVYDIEAGNKGLSAKSIRKIVDAFRGSHGLNSDYLLYGDIDKLPNALSSLDKKRVEALLNNALDILLCNEN